MIGRRKCAQWHWYAAEAVKAKAFVLCLIPGFRLLHSTMSECIHPVIPSFQLHIQIGESGVQTWLHMQKVRVVPNFNIFSSLPQVIERWDSLLEPRLII